VSERTKKGGVGRIVAGTIRAVKSRAHPRAAVACIEMGWRCGFVARGRSAAQAISRFWHHARAEHSVDLSLLNPSEKTTLEDLVEVLSMSTRRPAHSRAATSPGLRELEASGVVRRWFT
jgi:predicted small metal-binding protein